MKRKTSIKKLQEFKHPLKKGETQLEKLQQTQELIRQVVKEKNPEAINQLKQLETKIKGDLIDTQKQEPGKAVYLGVMLGEVKKGIKKLK